MKNLICNNICRGDKPFKRTARKHQSDFRANELKVPFDSTSRFGKYGAFLMPADADAGLNFCKDFREEIMEQIARRYPYLTSEQHDGLCANMLRSEHIPWNFFVPMMQDLKVAAHVFDDVLGVPEIDEVTEIRIEWAPKEKSVCLNDNTSFDTYMEYLHDGKLGGIGIEVKYTEESYPFGEKERHDVMENKTSRYAQVTKACGWFVPEISQRPLCDTPLCKDDYRQIWRNHILGASMLQNGMIDRFHSITLYPKGNPHFLRVLPEYERFLMDNGRATFGYVTMERLIELFERHFPKTTKFQNWIQYLNRRYVF